MSIRHENLLKFIFSEIDMAPFRRLLLQMRFSRNKTITTFITRQVIYFVPRSFHIHFFHLLQCYLPPGNFGYKLYTTHIYNLFVLHRFTFINFHKKGVPDKMVHIPKAPFPRVLYLGSLRSTLFLFRWGWYCCSCRWFGTGRRRTLTWSTSRTSSSGCC